MNASYKHLEARLRIGEFTIMQWAALIIGGIVALVWGLYISPLGPELTVFTACYIGGLPAGAVFLAAISEVDALLLIRSAIGWRRSAGRYVGGAGARTRGYNVTPTKVEDWASHEDDGLEALDPAALWT